MGDTTANRFRALRRAIMGVLVIAVVAVLVMLGNWQMERLAWKEDLIASMTERRTADPLTLAEIEALQTAGQDIDYRPVRLSGVFDHEKERYFLATLDGEPGFHVYTPLWLADGRAVLVNRGFVPETRRDRNLRKTGLAEGAVVIDGLARARLAEKPGSVPDNDPSKNLFFWKDLDAMAASAGVPKEQVLPLFIDAGPTTDPDILPKGGVTIFSLPNNHMQYALTWYGLAIALVGVVAFAFLKGRSDRRRDEALAKIE